MHAARAAVELAQIKAARALVAAALRVVIDEIDPDAAMSAVPIWDSFGQLSVILAVEEAVRVRIRDQASFNRLTSVRGIAAFLADPPGIARQGSL